MKNCVFCKIVAGELPCHKVYEDDLFLGFLDITPRTRGHSLLIPKKHYRWVYDVPEFQAYWSAVLELTHKMQTALSPHFVSYVTHGLEISHAHIHIFPRGKDENIFVPQPISVPHDEIKNIATAIFNTNTPTTSY